MRPTSAKYTSQWYRHARTKNRKTRAQQITHKTVKENKNTTTHTAQSTTSLLACVAGGPRGDRRGKERGGEKRGEGTGERDGRKTPAQWPHIPAANYNSRSSGEHKFPLVDTNPGCHFLNEGILFKMAEEELFSSCLAEVLSYLKSEGRNFVLKPQQ